MAIHPDLKLLETESPQDQVDRMGNGWKFEAQYDKQLELPVHAISPGLPQLQELERDGQKKTVPVYTTVCGLVLGEVTLRSTDVDEDVTCKACAKG